MLVTRHGSKKNTGFSIIEILVVVAVLGMTLTYVLALAAFSIKRTTSIEEFTKADFLAQELLEQARAFRDGSSWSIDGLGSVSSGAQYFFQKSSDATPKWLLMQGQEQVEGLARSIVFGDVFRDSNDNIIEAGGTLDLNTKKAIANVSWKGKRVQISTYLTNWR